MNTPTRYYSFADRLISNFDRALQTLTPGTQAATRPTPAQTQPQLSTSERRHSAGLMRVNHTGEVCAQALYQGQALTAKLIHVREEMEQAAAEEIDHLAWCEDRLRALGHKPSLLNPIWYSASFAIGAVAGLISDKFSLGFVAATEDQVCEHLQDHLEQLPAQDAASRAIVNLMLEDEYKHGQAALRAGGWEFPPFVKRAMRALSKVMTFASYRV